ncbi:hypothetical protein AGMMS50212_17010 [Spirochaetia bacterium]|nr:hypothetical protein AGMMS50212_17010 [Spirochaetia bacterium]
MIVEKDAVIALAGRSGWAKEQGFYFSIYDKKEKRWVNPAIIISPPPDSRPPSINAVKLVDSEKQVFDTASTRRLKQGLYFINVQAQDTVQSALDKPLMPHRITTSVNGSETETLSFETFFARDGMLMMYRNSLIPVSQIYAPYPFIEAGEVWFNRGQATLEITVHDVFGNSRRSVFNLFVE